MEFPLLSEIVLGNPALQELWFYYVTFHDPIQWAVMLLVGWTAWGQRKKKQELHDLAIELQTELDHVHEELHVHMQEDAKLHRDLGQDGITEGEPANGTE